LKIENLQTCLMASATYKRSLLCCAPNCAPLSPDAHLLQLVRLLFDRVDQPGSLVRGEPLETCHHVRFGHVDVIALGNTRGTVPHHPQDHPQGAPQTHPHPSTYLVRYSKASTMRKRVTTKLTQHPNSSPYLRTSNCFRRSAWLHLRLALTVTMMNPRLQTSGLTAIARTGTSVLSVGP
jgi:hypothetical protein